MSPTELSEYLKVLRDQDVGAAVVRLPNGARIQVSFNPQLPAAPDVKEVSPGGWKSPLDHLDNVSDLRQVSVDDE